ncbi:hypothetical protein [Thiocapsa bogorovii]|nr:hypothetical protein [Thiocapsa bogorovii]
MAEQTYSVGGIVLKSTGTDSAGLGLESLDSDLLFDKLLGSA